MADIPIIYLSGAGGGMPDFDVFRADGQRSPRFAPVPYPGWKAYIQPGYSAEVLLSDLAARIEAAVPEGPIRIVGLSLGGHLAYMLALELQSRGREIAGICAIDSFIITSAAPSAGWQARALAEALGLVSAGRIVDLMAFMRSRFWRALIRLSGGKLPVLLRLFPFIFEADPVLEQEISMRLLIRITAPWLASVDRAPVALNAPASLLRTVANTGDDAAWRRRCPEIETFEVPGGHHTLFQPENVQGLREAFRAATRNW